MRKALLTWSAATVLTVSSTSAFAEDMFVCLSYGVHFLSHIGANIRGYGRSEEAARTAALQECRLQALVNCQITYCGRTTDMGTEAD